MLYAPSARMRGCLAAAGACLALGPLSGQQPQTPQVFRARTNLVRVDVFATHDTKPVQDLTRADFQVVEDGAPQTIDSFEHVLIQPTGVQSDRVEPNSVREANQAAADPRRRVFVIFLDTGTVDVTGSHNIKEPLIEMMNRMMGPDDLVAIMTPEMSPEQLTFTRRTDVIEAGLRENWIWGRRDSLKLDDRENFYSECFPPGPRESTPSAMAQKMIDRRRERLVMDSLVGLVRYMGGLREGRTAVVAITDGWVLYKPDPTLNVPRQGDPSAGSPPPVGVMGGHLVMGQRPDSNTYVGDRTQCDADRMALAAMDDDDYFRQVLLGEANHADVSFYPVEPRGLAAVDSPIGPSAPLPPALDALNLRSRQDSLRVLAFNTDGIALLDNNNLTHQMHRIADDLTSYYLLGYYSTNSKLDGRFRTIQVKVTRPGIEVRARKGYRAPTEAEVAAAKPAPDGPAADAAASIARALGSLETDPRAGRPTADRNGGEPLVFHRGPTTGNQYEPAATRLFSRSDRIRLEIEARAGSDAWTAALLDRTGKTLPIPVATGDRTDATSGQRWLTAELTLAPLGAGDYLVELTSSQGSQTTKKLVAIRITR